MKVLLLCSYSFQPILVEFTKRLKTVKTTKPFSNVEDYYQNDYINVKFLNGIKKVWLLVMLPTNYFSGPHGSNSNSALGENVFSKTILQIKKNLNCPLVQLQNPQRAMV